MKYKEITEYQMVPTQPFKMPDFSSGQYLSKIKSRKGDIFEIWKMVDEEHLGYAAIDPKIGPKKPIAYLGFQMISVVMMAKNAYTLKKYQKQGKKGNLSQDAFYANWVEYGHHYAPKGKHGYGSRAKAMQAVRSGSAVISGSMYIAAHPFMRPAFDSKKTEAQDAICTRLSQRIEEAFKS